MEKRSYKVIGVSIEEEWNMFFGDIEEAELNGAYIEGGDILTVHEYKMRDHIFPTLMAARKYVAHCAGVPVSEVAEVGRRTWLSDDLPAEDWRRKTFLEGFCDGASWIIEEI